MGSPLRALGRAWVAGLGRAWVTGLGRAWAATGSSAMSRAAAPCRVRTFGSTQPTSWTA